MPYLSTQGHNIIQSKAQPPSDRSGSQGPIDSFIQLERYNALQLVQSVHGTLAALSKVIRGTSLLTSEVQKLAAALLKQEVSLVSKCTNIMFKLATIFFGDPTFATATICSCDYISDSKE